MYNLKISGYIGILFLSVPNVALAGRTGYIRPNPLIDTYQALVGSIMACITLRWSLKGLNPKANMNFKERIGQFIFGILCSLIWLYLASYSLYGLGLIRKPGFGEWIRIML